MPAAVERARDLPAPSWAPAGPACRVLHVVLSLNPGGTERLVLALVERLAGAVSSAICCIDEVGAWGEALRVQGVSVTALSRRPGFRPGLGRAVARAARAHGADVIHCHHYSPLVYAVLSKVFHRTPRIVFTEHGRLADAPPSPRRRLANTVLARVPDAVFAVSGDLREHLLREGFAGDRVRVLHNGIDPGPLPSAPDRADARRELGLPRDVWAIGTVARLDPVKDLTTLVEAFARVLARRSDARLVVIGDGPDRPAIESAVRAHGAGAAVTLLGHRDDVRQLLAGLDVYVNCSTFEGISLTILEAMAAGLPVVATRVGGNPEVVDDSVGVLVPARGAGLLADALLALEADPARRSELGANARHRVERDFSLDRMVQEYLQIYRSAACAALPA